MYFSENRVLYKVMRKNMVQPGRPQTIIRRMRIAYRLPTAIKHTLRICNTYCFPMATIVTRTPLEVAFIRLLPALCNSMWKTFNRTHRTISVLPVVSITLSALFTSTNCLCCVRSTLDYKTRREVI